MHSAKREQLREVKLILVADACIIGNLLFVIEITGVYNSCGVYVEITVLIYRVAHKFLI